MEGCPSEDLRVNRRYKIETPRLVPGRSGQQRYCTIALILVKLKIWAQGKKVKTRTLKTAGCGTRLITIGGFRSRGNFPSVPRFPRALHPPNAKIRVEPYQAH